MDDIKNDPRFAHIATDPRFRPMPKSKRKVKIDSRFQSLFTNKHFSHKTDIDKRGRPVLDWTKKSKHVMERFYELSDSDLESDNKSDNEVENEGQQLEQSPKTKTSKLLQSKEVKKKSVKITDNKKQDSTSNETVQKKKRKRESLQAESSLKAKKAKQQKLTKVDNEDDAFEDEEMKENDINKTNGEGPSDDNESFEEGENDYESSVSEDDDAELPEFTQEYDLEETNIEHKWNELHTDAPAVTESTHRLAVCNMDWDFVKAQDLYVLFKSFVPEGGRVKSVIIYPSEFGKERMAEEALLGPREIRKGEKMDGDSDDEDDKKKKKRIKDQKKMKQYEKERKALQTEKLREYQLNRLRYYFAVVDCDSIRTADAIYSECDGREYQLSSVRLDLRYIPDDMTFDDGPKDSFSEEQSVVGYQPNKFNSTALSQGKVDVTWDETEFDRLTRQISALPQKELESIVEENKYADIIAPPESDSENSEDERPAWLRAALSESNEDGEKELTEEEKIKLYRKVLMDALAENEEEKKKEGETDKEIEWQPGLKEKVQKNIKKKEKEADSTIVSGFLDKKRDKKKKKRKERMSKKAGLSEGDVEVAFSDDEIPEDMGDESLKELMEGEKLPVKGKKSKKKKQKKKEEVVDEAEERAKAELELMVMDEGSSEKKLSKPELVSESKKKKKKKAKLLKQKKLEAEQVEDFKLDVEDPRFSALYTSHLFHIDPTAPQFKKTKNMMKLVDEQIKRKKPKNNSEAEAKQQTANTGSKTFSEVLVESLKRKMKK